MKNKLNKYLKRATGKKIWLASLCAVAVMVLVLATTQPALASDPGTTSVSSGTLANGGRQIVTSSNGTLVAVYLAGSQSPTGIAYSTSTNGGTTWSAATAVDTSASTATNPAIAIDSNDNIFVAYRGGNNLVEKKLTYSAGSWSVQASPTTVATGSTCSSGCYTNPSVAIQSGNKIVISADFENVSTISSQCVSFLSSNGGSSWGTQYSTGVNVGNSVAVSCNTVAIGADTWILATGDSLIEDQTVTVEKDIGTTGAWTNTGAVIGAGTNFVSDSSNSMTSSGSGVLDIYYLDMISGNLVYTQYSIAGNSFGPNTSISTNTSNVFGSISAGPSSTIYAFYQEYQGVANSYKVAYKKYSGSWSGANYVSADTTNNTNISAAVNNGSTNTNKLGVLWTNGTATPWTIKGSSLTMNSAPAAPTPSTPANTATGISATPTFNLKTTDADNDYLRYRIYLCAVSGCNSGTALYTWDQTQITRQLGWTGQDQQSGTAYTGNSVIGSSTTASFQPSILLSVGQTYYWVAQAIDPAGTNTWGSLSSASSFTTTGSQVNINGGTNITGGTNVQ